MDINNYESYIFDCDGVLWKGTVEVPGSIQALLHLQSLGKKVFFLTNSARTKEDLSSQLSSFGFTATFNQIHSAGTMLPLYINKHYPEAKNLFFVGLHGEEILTNEGFNVIRAHHIPNNKITSLQDLIEFRLQEVPDAVVVCHDINFDYHAGLYASACIQEGAKFISANYDDYFILGNWKMASCGTLCKYLEGATGQKAEIVGKPNSFMIEEIIEENNLDRSKCIMVGDTIDSDVLLAHNAHIDSMLVLTGVSKMEDIEKYEYKPTFVFESLGSAFIA